MANLTSGENSVLLTSPLHVPKNLKGDKWYLNLNNVNNTHYQTYNKVKVRYKDHMRPQLESLKPFRKVSVTFILYPETKRLCDIENVCCVHHKFFMDALVSAEKLPDDNYLYVPECHYYIGEVDKDNPRVEVILKELNHETV